MPETAVSAVLGAKLLAKTKSCAVVGLDGFLVEVEVDISPGLPAFHIVGLPDAAVQESKERVRAAIRNSGAEFPMRRITVSLAPADVKKSGPSYDLPIAIGILLSSGQVPDSINGSLLLGELALDGALRPTQGILPMVAVGREMGIKNVFVPSPNAAEAALVEGVNVTGVDALSQLAGHLRSEISIPLYQAVHQNVDKPREGHRTKRARSRRGSGAGTRKAGAGGRRGGWPQHADDRPARLRQNPPGEVPAVDPAADDGR